MANRIGLMSSGKYGKNGIDIFQANIIPEIVKSEGFEKEVFSVRESYPFSRTIETFFKKRKLPDKISKYDKFFVFSQDRLYFDPSKVDAEVYVYVHDLFAATTLYRKHTGLRNILSRNAELFSLYSMMEADVLIAASMQTAEEIRNRTPFSGCVEVVYQGVDNLPSPDNYADLDRDIDLLFVGSTIERKNPELVEETIKKASENGFNCVTVTDREFEGATNLENISDKQLAELYLRSHFYLHTSKVEGFGRTPVEAQRYGCIPLALDTPINYEVLGSKGVAWLPIASSNGVVNYLERFESDTARNKARKNAEQYKWSDTREELKEVLKQ